MATHSSILAWRIPWTEESGAAAAAKSLQLCPTLCDPMDCSLPGSSIHGISRQECWSGVSLPSPLVLVMMVELILSLDTTGKSFLSPGPKFLCAYMSPASNLVKMKIVI